MFKIFTLVLAFALASGHAIAQEFPKKQAIKIIVPFGAGGLADVLARITADALSRRIGQAVIVDNKPGAASAIGTEILSRTPADGYTLMLSTADLAVLPAVRTTLPYKFDELTFLTRFVTTGPMIVVSPRSQFTSFEQLISYMKANPGKLTYATPGIGSLNHLGTLQMLNAAGVEALHVPYSGAALVYTALLGESIDFYNGATQPFPDTLKVIAASRKVPNRPQVRTLEEMGFKTASYEAWYGIVGPPNLPKLVVDRLNAELRAVFQDPAVIAKINSSANLVPDEKLLVGDEFRQRVLQEFRNWKDVAEREKIVLQP